MVIERIVADKDWPPYAFQNIEWCCTTKHWQGITSIHPQPVSNDMAIKMEDILIALDAQSSVFIAWVDTRTGHIIPTENYRMRIADCSWSLWSNSQKMVNTSNSLFLQHTTSLWMVGLRVKKFCHYRLASQIPILKWTPWWRSPTNHRFSDWRWRHDGTNRRCCKTLARLVDIFHPYLKYAPPIMLCTKIYCVMTSVRHLNRTLNKMNWKF